MKAHHPINPPPYEPLEHEYQIAWYKQILERIVNDYLLGIDMCRKGTYGDSFDDDYAEKQLSSLCRELFTGPDGDQEFWEDMLPYEEFKKEMKDALSGPHLGDCVSFPMSCGRCYFEGLAGTPSTVTWESKGEGWSLLQEFRELSKEE